jgi:phosphatidylglycerol:prolipoprotein diacylglycerol transferase
VYPEIRLLGVSLGSYVALYAAALLVGALLFRAELRRRGYPRRLWLLLTVAGAVGAFAGSKVYVFLVAPETIIFSSPRTYFSLAGTGWYGALIGGGLALALSLRIAGVPLLAAFDTIVPAVPVAQVLGRLGCFLAGCCAGRPTDVPWAVVFPDDPGLSVHPVQLYEGVALAGVAALLWRRRSPEPPEGSQTGLYLLLAGATRFAVEFLRLNPSVVLFLTIPHIVATLEGGLGSLLLLRSTAFRSVPRPQ